MLKTLQLTPSPAPVRKAQAWFLPGKNPADWLAEVAAWPAPTDRLKFYLLPEPGLLEPAGVLVVPSIPIELPAGSRGQPYGEAAKGYFLPVDAALTPPLEGTELQALCHFALLVHHPALGLVGFTHEDAREAEDLLSAPPAAAENWAAAREIPTPGYRLRSVRLLAPLTLAEIFGEESRDIGSEPLVDLPPSAKFPESGPAGLLADQLKSALMRGITGLTGLVPRNPLATTPTWINHLENWAQKNLSSLTRDLERQRHRELQRLLEMLEKNPEEGLRHAIPLAGQGNRGLAPPSAQLGRRSLDFNWQRLGGGQAADFWNIPYDFRQNLSRQYRENAQREVRLGRHRRAAYIYAELLGDHSAAADALRQGRFYREAALVYEKRLRQPLLAAACLAEGGFYLEAVALYEAQGKWLESAELYEKAGRPEEAKAAFRKAVEAHLAAHDRIAAARLLEHRLQATDEALAVLAAAWPGGQQAFLCLEEQCALLGRHQRNPELKKLVVSLGRERCPPQRTAELVRLLTQLAENAVVLDIRRTAAESARHKISAFLLQDSPERSEEVSILRSLTRLVPQDRLLGRDVIRFREKKPAVPLQRLRPPSAGLIRRLTLEKDRTINLPKIGTWIRFSGSTRRFAAVARRENRELFFSRGSWNGALQSASWMDPAPELGSSLIFRETMPQRMVVLVRPFAAPFPPSTLPATDRFDNLACDVGTPPWLPDDVVQVAEMAGLWWIVRAVNGRITLDAHQGGNLVHTKDVTELLMTPETAQGADVLLEPEISGQQIALGYGSRLLIFQGQQPPVSHSLPSRIIGLLPAPKGPAGWIVLLEQGAYFISAGSEHSHLDDTMPAPRGAFLGDGRLVLLSATEGKIFQRHAGRLVPAAWFPAPPESDKIIGLSPTDESHTLAVAMQSGAIVRWKIPV